MLSSIHHWLFFARRLGLDAGRWLGSWRLSIVIMMALALYQVLLAIWSTSSPGAVVGRIAQLLPFHLVYVLLLANLGTCLWRRLPRLRLGSGLFHGAFFLVAGGFLLTFVSRQEATLRLAEGERLSGAAEQFVTVSPPRVLSLGLPTPDLTAQSITPDLWRDQLLFTNLGADLAEPDGRVRTTRINRPIWWDAATFIRLSGFGYTPRYELKDRHGRVLDSAYVKLDVFPPGQRDVFRIPGYPHRFYVEVLPDYADEDGTAVTRSLELVNPAVELEVWRGRVALGQALLAGDAGFEVEGLTLSFPEIRYWGEFTMVRDPGATLLFVGYALAMAGLALELRAWWKGGRTP